MSRNMDYVCSPCGERWSADDLKKERWAGVPFCQNGSNLICPNCYEQMRASFVGAPDSFALWKAQYGFCKEAEKRGLLGHGYPKKSYKRGGGYDQREI